MSKSIESITKKIEFQDFSKSVSTEEFLGIYHLTEAINDNFNKALDNRKKKLESSKENLSMLLKSNGRFGVKYLEEKAMHKGLELVLIDDIKKGYSKFLQNYDGIIEFLKRFNASSDSVKKRNIRIFKNKKKDE